MKKKLFQRSSNEMNRYLSLYCQLVTLSGPSSKLHSIMEFSSASDSYQKKNLVLQ